MMRWTPERIEQLRELAAAGHTQATAAAALGTTTAASVSTVACRNHIRFHASDRTHALWTPALIEQLRTHAAAGDTQAVAGAAIGRTAAAVGVIASTHGISFHGKRRPWVPLEVIPALERARRELAAELAQARRERSGAPLYRRGPQ